MIFVTSDGIVSIIHITVFNSINISYVFVLRHRKSQNCLETFLVNFILECSATLKLTSNSSFGYICRKPLNILTAIKKSNALKRKNRRKNIQCLWSTHVLSYLHALIARNQNFHKSWPKMVPCGSVPCVAQGISNTWFNVNKERW